MDKLNVTFTPAQILKAELMNLISAKIDELVDAENSQFTINAKVGENTLRIDAIIASDVDISQAEFDALQESGGLDETKTYYIYE